MPGTVIVPYFKLGAQIVLYFSLLKQIELDDFVNRGKNSRQKRLCKGRAKV